MILLSSTANTVLIDAILTSRKYADISTLITLLLGLQEINKNLLEVEGSIEVSAAEEWVSTYIQSYFSHIKLIICHNTHRQNFAFRLVEQFSRRTWRPWSKTSNGRISSPHDDVRPTKKWSQLVSKTTEGRGLSDLFTKFYLLERTLRQRCRRN